MSQKAVRQTLFKNAGTMPKCSVIIPTYNRKAQLGAAVESVLSQTKNDLEIVIIDDGSTDGTCELLEQLQLEHPAVVRHMRQENRGKAAALNVALAHVKGEFVAFLDSDDRWLPGKLERQFRALEECGKDLPCFTDAHYVNNPRLQTSAFDFANRRYAAESGTIPEPARLFLEGRSGVYIQSLLLSRQLAGQVGLFETNSTIGEDTDYLFRLALLTPFCFVNAPLVEIDRTVNRKVGLIDRLYDDERARIEQLEYLYHKWLRLSCDHSHIRALVLRRLAEVHNDWGNWHLERCEYGKARASMARSVRTYFTSKIAMKLALTTVAPAAVRAAYLRRDQVRAQCRVSA